MISFFRQDPTILRILRIFRIFNFKDTHLYEPRRFGEAALHLALPRRLRPQQPPLPQHAPLRLRLHVFVG